MSIGFGPVDNAPIEEIKNDQLYAILSDESFLARQLLIRWEPKKYVTFILIHMSRSLKE